MPLPVILGFAAAAAGVAGVGAGLHGAAKMKDANDTMNAAKSRHSRNIARFEERNKATCQDMDKLGKLELEILQSFGSFADVIEQIHNRPQFESPSQENAELPKYDGEKLKEVSVGAGALLGGLGGAAAGTAGGFAAAGATTAAVMALGTASTGTAIASLSGAALTNATLAALGGGAIAAGGGGIALGTTILGATTLGVGLLVGGIIFNFTGGKMSDKADEAYQQMKEAELSINKICVYLSNLRSTSNQYFKSMSEVNAIYQKHLNGLTSIVTLLGHNNWDQFTDEEKKLTENTVLLVGLLYKMCQVQLVLKAKNEKDMNKINSAAVQDSVKQATSFLQEKGFRDSTKKTNTSQGYNAGGKSFSLTVFSADQIKERTYDAEVRVNHAPVHAGDICYTHNGIRFEVLSIKNGAWDIQTANEGSTVTMQLLAEYKSDPTGKELYQNR